MLDIKTLERIYSTYSKEEIDAIKQALENTIESKSSIEITENMNANERKEDTLYFYVTETVSVIPRQVKVNNMQIKLD